MKTIKTIQNLISLREQALLSQPYLDYLEEYFTDLHEELGDGQAIEEFTLQQHGYMVVLEQDDDVRDLREIGLNPNHNGLLGSYPEFVDAINLSDGTLLYQVVLVYDNDFAMSLFSLAGQFLSDPEVNEWFHDQCNCA